MECGVGARRTTLQDFVQMCSLLPDSSPEIWILYTSVEHDPVSGSPSKWILQFRTGSGSDWISKKLVRIGYGYSNPNCSDHCSKMFNHSFYGYKPDWIKYLGSTTGLGLKWITQWKYWTGLGLQKSPISSTLVYSVHLCRPWIRSAGIDCCRVEGSAFFLTQCQAKFLNCEISDLTPCVHAQYNITVYI